MGRYNRDAEGWHKNFLKDSLRFNTGITLKGSDVKLEFIHREGLHSDGSIMWEDTDETKMPVPMTESDWNKCAVLNDGKLFLTIPTTKEYSGENGIYVTEKFDDWFIRENGNVGIARKIARWNLDNHHTMVMGLELAMINW